MNEYIKRVCEEYDPEKDVSGLAGGSYGHYLADRIIAEREIENGSKANELEVKLKFLNKVKTMGVNPENVFSDRDIKQKLIREFKGYTRLKASEEKSNKGKSESLSKSSDQKIGLVFKNIYYATLKEVNK